MPSRSRMYDYRFSSIQCRDGARRFSPTRQTLLVPKRGRTSPAVWDGGRELNLHEALAVVHHDCFRLLPPRVRNRKHVNAQRRGRGGIAEIGCQAVRQGSTHVPSQNAKSTPFLRLLTWLHPSRVSDWSTETISKASCCRECPSNKQKLHAIDMVRH